MVQQSKQKRILYGEKIKKEYNLEADPLETNTDCDFDKSSQMGGRILNGFWKKKVLRNRLPSRKEIEIQMSK